MTPALEIVVVVTPVARVESVLYSNWYLVEVVPTVRLPLRVAVVLPTDEAAFVVADTTESAVEMFEVLNDPPSAAITATSSLAA